MPVCAGILVFYSTLSYGTHYFQSEPIPQELIDRKIARGCKTEYNDFDKTYFHGP